MRERQRIAEFAGKEKGESRLQPSTKLRSGLGKISTHPWKTNDCSIDDNEGGTARLAALTS